jgi:catechol 2,3-dioxygenase-like lactoylglutathione lyase family enzyme
MRRGVTVDHLKKGVAYLVIGVTDLARSVAFYRDTLGLPLQFQQGELAFLAAGPVTLMLSADLGRARTPVAGAMEIVFPVDAVTPAWRALAAGGVTFFREPRQVTDKEWSAVMQDPDGHFLTLFGPPGA